VDNRTNLLSHALRLFAARGYDAVGVQEIAEAAGVTKPTLYHYFGNKRGLLDALLEERTAPLRKAIDEAVIYPADLTLTLRNVIGAYFDFADREPTLYGMQLSMYYAPPASEAFHAASQLYRAQLEHLEALFVQAAEYHGNLRGRHRAYATTLLGTIHAYTGLALSGECALDDQLVRQAAHQFMHGILS
jgi:TetR/AcrR family transcriptional regulator